MYSDHHWISVVLIAAISVLAGCGPSSTSNGTTDSGSIDPTADKPLIARLNLPELSADKQKEIWEVEHVAFKLEQRFGKLFVNALRSNDSTSLRNRFRDVGQHGVLDHSKKTSLSHATIIEERLGDDPRHQIDASADELISFLLKSLSPIQSFEQSTLRVLKLARDKANARQWNARLFLAFTGSTADNQRLSVQSEHLVSFHIENESDYDAGPIISSWICVSQTSRTSSNLLMEEVTREVELDGLDLVDNWREEAGDVEQYRFQIAVADFDRDDFLDIAVMQLASVEAPILLRSVNGEKFEDWSDELIPSAIGGPPLDAGTYTNFLASWIDYDNDGYPDLILGRRLYHNLQGKSFEDVTLESGLQFAHVPMGCCIADYDCDGLVDLYVIYQEEKDGDANHKGPKGWIGDNETGAENQLWRNEGNGRFRNVTMESGAGAGRGSSFAASWFFLDEDRFPDLYVANDFGENMLLRNRGNGTFEDITSQTNTGDYATSMGVATGDLDNDGRSEIYVANMYSKMGRRIIDHVCENDYPAGIFPKIQGSCAGNRLYRRSNEKLKYSDLGNELGVNDIGWAYAPAMVDVDCDGLLDIYATTGFLSFNRGKPDG